MTGLLSPATVRWPLITQAKLSLGEKRPATDTMVHSVALIHAGGDNYSDQPAPLGGGGVRLACGVAK
jgi:Cu/Zn superoxide dismutase